MISLWIRCDDDMWHDDVRDDATDADEVVVCDKDVMISITNQMEVCDAAEVTIMCVMKPGLRQRAQLGVSARKGLIQVYKGLINIAMRFPLIGKQIDPFS
jgi:hypothetical protein